MSACAASQLSPSVVLLEARRVAKTKKATGAAKGRDEAEAKVISKPSKKVGEQIGKELQKLYANLLAQPAPQRFLDLLSQLDAKTASSMTASKSRGERE